MSNFRASILLCDFASSVGGKLYIHGGGWDRFRGPAALNCHVAVQLLSPWDAANEQHAFRIVVRDSEGNEARNERMDNEVIWVGGDFEFGRPPYTPHGQPLSQVFSVTFTNVALRRGAYTVALTIDGTDVAAVPLTVDSDAGFEPIAE